MRKHNGKQLYGIQKILTTLKMGMNKELKKISIKQKLALNYVSKESKLTRIGDKIYTNISNDVIFSKKKAEWPLKKQATLEILDECPSFNDERLPEFYKRMGFPVNRP